ncbi:MAG: urease accessory protein UreF [Rhizobiaceae bacterium]|nr:urease accessory protein UreF [Rhizobiaceae bacterium]
MTGLSSQQTLYKLQTWFSPSFPVGAYTYSHGLEFAYETGLIKNVDDAVDWISHIIKFGSGFADLVFLKEAHIAVSKSDFEHLSVIAEFATAFAGTVELRLESEAQGAAFIETIQKVDPLSGINSFTEKWPGPYAYPVVIGVAAGDLAIDSRAIAMAYLHGFVANLASALVRIIPLGQTDGQRIISALAPIVEQTVEQAIETELDDLSTSTMMVDLTSMQHETQYTRLFRS